MPTTNHQSTHLHLSCVPHNPPVNGNVSGQAILEVEEQVVVQNGELTGKLLGHVERLQAIGNKKILGSVSVVGL